MQTSEVVSRCKRRSWATAGIVLGLVVMAIIRSGNSDRGEMPLVVPEPSAAEIVNRHLAWADSQRQVDLGAKVAPIRELFSEARMGTRRFAEDALSFKSKWKLATDFVTSGNEHAEFLRERFAFHVFAPEALELAMQAVVADHVRHLEDVDSELLVRLQADLTGVPNLQLSANIDREAIQTALDHAIRQAINAIEGELGPGAGFELVSWIAGEALTAATFRLAASSGILGAGAVSGAVSFGVGLVVGIIVDYVISWVYDEVFDPVGELSRQLNQTLDALEQLILTGDSSGPGLIQRLQEYGTRRSRARNAAIRSFVLPQSAELNASLAF